MRRRKGTELAISNLRRPFTTVVDRHGQGRIVYLIVYIVPEDVSPTIFDLWFWDAAKAETRTPGEPLRTSGPREFPPFPLLSTNVTRGFAVALKENGRRHFSGKRRGRKEAEGNARDSGRRRWEILKMTEEIRRRPGSGMERPEEGRWSHLRRSAGPEESIFLEDRFLSPGPFCNR